MVEVDTMNQDTLQISYDESSMIAIKPIKRRVAKRFIEKYHYTHSVGKVSIAYGLFDGSLLVGAVVYGQVSAKEIPQFVWDYGTQSNTYELLRMAVIDDCQYPRSKFLSQTIKMLKREHIHIKCLITYADSTQGHIGTIYQATNWIYTGTTGLKYHYIVDGKRLNKRTIYDKAKSISMSEKSYAQSIDAKLITESPKHRYILPLRRYIKIKPKTKPYPKQEM